MLISMSDAINRYGISRRTLNRRLADGILTRHTHADTGQVMLDIDELDALTQPDATTTDEDDGDGGAVAVVVESTQGDVGGVEPRGIAERFLIHPDDLDEAVRRAMRPTWLPRLRR